MFRIHKETDYALIALYHIASKDDYIPLSDIISKTKMPQRFLARITAKLTRRKILISKEGRTGGYKLAKNLSQITLYEFLRIFENDLHVLRCERKTYKCSCREYCSHKTFFSQELRNAFIKQLQNITLNDVFKK